MPIPPSTESANSVSFHQTKTRKDSCFLKCWDYVPRFRRVCAKAFCGKSASMLKGNGCSQAKNSGSGFWMKTAEAAGSRHLVDDDPGVEIAEGLGWTIKDREKPTLEE